MKILTTALELLGFALLTAAAVLVCPVLGVAVAGAFLIVIGYLLGREPVEVEGGAQ